MKIYIRYLILVQTLTLVTSPLFANVSVIAIGLQSGQSALEAFRTLSEKENKEVSTLEDKTGKFENDNIFVQLYPLYNTSETKVAHRDVSVVLPPRLNYDSLMEALIKIRAAKTFGANNVDVNSELELKDVIIEGELANELSLEELIATAGADTATEKGQSRDLTEPKRKKNQVAQSDSWIGSTNYPELLNEVATLTGKKTVRFEDLKTNREKLKGQEIYWISATTTPVNAGFFQTLAEIRWMVSQGAVVHLISPYLPYARSDKPEFDRGVTTQGRLVADLIEAVGTQGITVVRAHAPQSLGFFKIHSDEISARPTLVDFLKSKEVDCIIAPDAGFQKDATKYQHELSKAYNIGKSVSLVVMNKERDSDGKERILGGTGLENIQNKRVVIIDDETSTGGTLHQVAQVVQQYQPQSIFAVVTHLAGPATKSLYSDFIHQLIVTNTVPVRMNHPKLKVISIAAEIAERIK